jgi:predicted Zn-dependent protease
MEMQVQFPPSWLAQTSALPSQEQLPKPGVHPLPIALAQWQDPEAKGDYFSEISPTPVGYLVWSEFPIRIWLEPANPNAPPFEVDRAQAWLAAVSEAIQEWSVYLPLARVDSPEIADVSIWRVAPPLQLPDPLPDRALSDAPTRSTRNHPLPRIRSAETRYHLFIDRSTHAPARLSHRFTIQLTPHQTTNYIKATARHELGHALGIWGHSPVDTDALYFSQVRDAPLISHRDINTLKRIYEQPTQVGWELLTE